jgi:hypothetical protein
MRLAHWTLRYLIDTETNRFYIQSPRIESQKGVPTLRAGQNSGSRKFVHWQTNPGFIQRHDLEAVCESGATLLGAFPASP